MVISQKQVLYRDQEAKMNGQLKNSSVLVYHEAETQRIQAKYAPIFSSEVIFIIKVWLCPATLLPRLKLVGDHVTKSTA